MSSTVEKRQKEFIWYHKNGDGDCNGQVLRAYAAKHRLSEQDCFDLTYFYSITYCCASAVFLLKSREQIKHNCSSFASEYKSKLIFQSDRKYVRMKDNFYKVLNTWRESLYNAAGPFHEKTVDGNVLSTKKALSIVENWYFFSRFSSYLFVETYCDILGYEATRERGLKYEGDSMTFVGGLLYYNGMDDEAAYVQKKHKLPIPAVLLEALISDLQDSVKEAGGDDNFTKLETSLCAYEKFFKGTRYNGFYADRQLGELVKMSQHQEFVATCAEIYEARSEAIPEQYRGETGGWDGIRPELNKRYRETHRIIGYPG